MQPDEEPATGRTPAVPATVPAAVPAAVVDAEDLSALFGALQNRGYTVVGPTMRDGAIVVAELTSVAELPFGWGVETEAGRYRLRQRADTAAFGHSAGPQSWKTVLHPARARVWSADLATGVVAAGESGDRPRYALLGVRPCDVRAIGILDTVLTGGRHVDPVYSGRRDGAFVIAVECTEPGAACFCSSMGCGPGADTGFDLVMTELVETGGHRFLVRVGTPAGAAVLAEVPSRTADDATIRDAATAVSGAGDRMGRTMPQGLPQVLADSRESPHWDDVASRCLTCGNCTMVCPTCFCTTTEDVTDLSGDHAERWRVWDSCFALDFSYLHGGSVRPSGQSRYRQWITHKLGTWHDQFGSSGCVGCGRCIAWCPTGIDITREMSALVVLQGSSATTDEDKP